MARIKATITSNVILLDKDGDDQIGTVQIDRDDGKALYGHWTCTGGRGCGYIAIDTNTTQMCDDAAEKVLEAAQKLVHEPEGTCRTWEESGEGHTVDWQDLIDWAADHMYEE